MPASSDCGHHNKLIMPLTAAYAITIHKCQGLTLPSITVDCRKIFAPGQLSVAISRVRSLANLTLLNFHPTAMPNQPEKVKSFLMKQTSSFSGNCCQINLHDVPQAIENTEVDSEEEQSPEPETDASIISEAIEFFLDGQPSPEVISAAQELLSKISCSEEETETQRSINRILRNITVTKVMEFATACKNSIVTVFHDHYTESCETKNMTCFQKECLQIVNQEVYDEHIKTLFGVAIPGRTEYIIANRIFSYTRGSILTEKLSESCSYESSKDPIISTTSQKKVYYLAGRCLFKIRKHYRQVLKSNAKLHSMNHLSKWCHAEAVLNDLSVLEKHVDDPKTLGEITSYTEEREYFASALTHPSDALFKFTIEVERRRHQHHCLQGMKRH